MSVTLSPEDVRAIASAVVDELADRSLVAAAQPARGGVLTADEVADMLGRKPDWVYANAGDLGGFRMGDGRKARLGFDEQSIERWKRDHAIVPTVPAATPRRPRGLRGRAAGTSLIDFDEGTP